MINLLQGARTPAERLVGTTGLMACCLPAACRRGAPSMRALGGRLEKIVALELGGNNPLVVWDAGDLESGGAGSS